MKIVIRVIRGGVFESFVIYLWHSWVDFMLDRGVVSKDVDSLPFPG